MGHVERYEHAVYVFNAPNAFTATDLASWNVGKVTDMYGMFQFTYEGSRNLSLSSWDVGEVTDMGWMFYYAREFNSDISDWDVSKVGSMQYMFYDARQFNSDISRWDVSNVQSMDYMFRGAIAFSADITGWSVYESENDWDNFYSGSMFEGAAAFIGNFTSCGYDDWDTSVCTGTYEDSSDMYDGPPGAWQRGVGTRCTDTVGSPFPSSGALKSAVASCLTAVPSGKNCCSTGGANCGPACAVEMAFWDVSLVTNMDELFEDKSDFNQDISQWDTSSVTSMRYMFSNAPNAFTATDPRELERGKGDGYVWDVYVCVRWKPQPEPFVVGRRRGDRYGLDVLLCGEFNSDISDWDVSKVGSMQYMFYDARQFNSDISRWDVSNVQSMDYMFRGAIAFSADITGWSVYESENDWDNFYSEACLRARRRSSGTSRAAGTTTGTRACARGRTRTLRTCTMDRLVLGSAALAPGARILLGVPFRAQARSNRPSPVA